ncbi:hypothetical protein B0A54_05774 [Friedmanniomyces endolithicus]|uniref:Rhodopsin domain-containing protein n=1 Tax=Friedmanniomyces endolithicus TaxID=329885 RepID=A0A4U0V498_9PEZI|nr:hypothetical protein LTS09_012416 [Friedmanniomyces endolithicus]TKA43293.1 hypothetical protein B0A54_05774 [Friedmanniomyces endolithicus]
MPGNLQDIPASVILTWPAPNYEHPHPQRTWIVPWVAVLQSVMTLLVGTRLWLRATRKAGILGLDDALLVPAFLSATMFSIVVIMSNRDYGSDRHVWDVRPEWFETALLLAWLGEFAFLISTCCTKISVLLFYRRLVQGTFSKRWRMATIGAIVFTACYCVAFILALVFNCNPTEAYWKAYSLTYTKSYTCANTKNLNPLAGALSVFSDLYSVVLPMGMLRHFEASKRQKLALNAIFSLGLIVVAAGCVRTYYIYQLGVDYDMTWVGYHLIIWSSLELHMALICASAPSLRVLFRQYMSDPLSRVVHSTRSLASTRDASRLSRQPNSAEIVTYSSQARNSSISSSNFGDRKPTQYNVTPSLDPVGESEAEMSSPYMERTRSPTLESRPIKTPAEFEAFALQNLEQHRPPPRAAFTRQGSDTFLRPTSAYSTHDDMHSHLEQPFTDWYSPPQARG